jgi:hypothetical protein
VEGGRQVQDPLSGRDDLPRRKDGWKVGGMNRREGNGEGRGKE